MGRLAVKTLTNSDLTIFEWHFRNRNAGNQKGINLNANVFAEVLYPQITNTDLGRAGRLPIDLYIYGPDAAPAINLQRKIIKGGSYKNWRLNGEFIAAPSDQADRFNELREGDFAVFDFDGDLFPHLARIVLVAAASEADRQLHQAIADHGVQRMRALEYSSLRLIANAGGVAETHPIHDLLLDSAIEDAAQQGIEGTSRLLQRGVGRSMSRSELERARQRASDIGQQGEELIDAYFADLVERGELTAAEWTASQNAISPFDFSIETAAEEQRKVEVKSTRAAFGQVLHLSYGELTHAANSDEPYDLYRVYGLDEATAKLRSFRDFGPYAKGLIDALASLPAAVTCDGVSLRPEQVAGFGDEESIELPEST